MTMALYSKLAILIIFGICDTLPRINAIQDPFSLAGVWVTKDGAQLTVRRDGHFVLRGTVFGKKYNVRGIVKSRRMSASELAEMGLEANDVPNPSRWGLVEFEYNDHTIRSYSSFQDRNSVIIECEPKDPRVDFPPVLFLNRKRDP